LVYDPDAAQARKESRKREGSKPSPRKRENRNFCPGSYHQHDRLTTAELSHINRKARDLELSSDEMLNLLILLHRKGQKNDLISLLDFLEALR
jgi:hypothetical protein